MLSERMREYYERMETEGTMRAPIGWLDEAIQLEMRVNTRGGVISRLKKTLCIQGDRWFCPHCGKMLEEKMDLV